MEQTDTEGADHIFVGDIGALIAEAPADSIVSRSVYDGPDAKVIAFAFAPGQALSEHTSGRPALLHLLRGHARIGLGGEEVEAGPGFWAHMPANLPHSVAARDDAVLLLVLLGAP